MQGVGGWVMDFSPSHPLPGVTQTESRGRNSSDRALHFLVHQTKPCARQRGLCGGGTNVRRLTPREIRPTNISAGLIFRI